MIQFGKGLKFRPPAPTYGSVGLPVSSIGEAQTGRSLELTGQGNLAKSVSPRFSDTVSRHRVQSDFGRHPVSTSDL